LIEIGGHDLDAGHLARRDQVRQSAGGKLDDVTGAVYNEAHLDAGRLSIPSVAQTNVALIRVHLALMPSDPRGARSLGLSAPRLDESLLDESGAQALRHMHEQRLCANVVHLSRRR
jgi:hypothetical protein